MKQSRATSLVKSLVSTAVGFAVAFVANMVILPLFGLPLTHSANVLLTSIYTVISIARGYLLERAFESLGWRHRISPFVAAAMAEQRRQVREECYDAAHDDALPAGELERCAAAYALNDYGIWPLTSGFKPYSPRRDLVRATALLFAAGEKLDRNRRPVRSTVAGAGVSIKQGDAS